MCLPYFVHIIELEDIGGFLLGDLVPSTVDFDVSPDEMNAHMFFDHTQDKLSPGYIEEFNTNSNTFESQSQSMYAKFYLRTCAFLYCM